MKNVKIFFSCLIVVIVLFAFWNPVNVCACLCTTPSIKKAFQESDIIFTGVVFDNVSSTREIVFLSQEVFKGTAIDNKIIIQDPDPLATTCDSTFEDFHLGERYLVYARFDEQGRLLAGPCSRTGSLESGYFEDTLSDLVVLKIGIFDGSYDKYIFIISGILLVLAVSYSVRKKIY